METMRLDRASFDRVKELVQQRGWEGYLASAGLPEKAMKGRMGPCPMCGGDTRFYMRKRDVSAGRGWCHHCGPLDGWEILKGLLRTDFAGAVQWVLDREAGGGVVVATRLPPPPKVKAEPNNEDLRQKYEKLWREGKPIQWGSDSPAARYLAWRAPGLGYVPDALREHPALEYWEIDDNDKFKLVGKYPALLARVTGPKGELANIWRTYLSPNGDKAPVREPKKAAGRFLAPGAAIRLGQPTNGRLGVAEGIEGALGAMLIGGPVTWACCYATMLKAFNMPEDLDIQVLTIYGDNDAPDHHGRRAGQEAARALRDRVKEQGKKAFVVLPASTRFDINDLVKGEAPSQKA